MGRRSLSDGELSRGRALASALAAARSRSGLTQSDVASRSGVPLDTIRKIEQGAIPTPGLFVVAAMAEAVSIGLADLIAATNLAVEADE
jgi:transcriptional regulator with XRE-family HTH domain